MIENVIEQTNCPACDKENELESTFCKFCGVNIETYDPETIEISETMRIRRISYILFGVIFFGIVVYLFLVFFPSITNDLEAKRIFWTTAGILIPVGGIGVFVWLLWILWTYRGAKFRRIVSISPRGIKIVLPREPIFEVSWSNFDMIHLWKSSGGNTGKDYKFYFISNGVVYDDITIKGSVHFSGRKCRTIIFHFKQYGAKMNVKFNKGKRLKR